MVLDLAFILVFLLTFLLLLGSTFCLNGWFTLVLKLVDTGLGVNISTQHNINKIEKTGQAGVGEIWFEASRGSSHCTGLKPADMSGHSGFSQAEAGQHKQQTEMKYQ